MDKASPEYLEHYGVKGMRWGVRKDRETKERDKATKRSEKAQKYKDRAAAYQKEIDDLNAIRPRSGRERKSRDKQKTELLSKRNQALEDAERKEQGKLTKKQKRLVIGGTVVAAVVAASVTYSTVSSGEGNRLMMMGKEFLGKEGGTFKKDDSLTLDFTPEALMKKVVAPINPDYGEKRSATQNCRRCTFAYELRRRGYDVEATKTSTAMGQTIYGLVDATDPSKSPSKSKGQIGTVFKVMADQVRQSKGKTSRTIEMINNGDFMQGEKRIFGLDGFGKSAEEKAKMVFGALSKEPDGSRGELGLTWRSGGGHSIVYEIVKGRPVIIDGQTGKMFRSTKSFLAYAEDAAKVDFTRLDDKPLDMDFLRRWAKNA